VARDIVIRKAREAVARDKSADNALSVDVLHSPIFLANVQAMVHSAAGDEILKNTFANNAFENFEIAAYKSFLAICGAAGMAEAKEPLEASLKEEQRMAAWIDSNVEKVTMEYLAHQRQAA
jgi:ferritin-like metal-binding protein YciE